MQGDANGTRQVLTPNSFFYLYIMCILFLAKIHACTSRYGISLAKTYLYLDSTEHCLS